MGVYETAEQPSLRFDCFLLSYSLCMRVCERVRERAVHMYAYVLVCVCVCMCVCVWHLNRIECDRGVRCPHLALGAQIQHKTIKIVVAGV